MMSEWVDPKSWAHKMRGERKDHCAVLLPEGNPVREKVIDGFFRAACEGDSKLFRRTCGRDPRDTEGNAAIDYIGNFKQTAMDIDILEVYQVQKMVDVDGCNFYSNFLESTYGKANMMYGYHGTDVNTAYKIVEQKGSSFDRSMTITDACGPGVYFGRYPHVSMHHALNGNPNGTGCLMVSEIYYNKIANTRFKVARPEDFDCGGSGTGEKQWIVTSTKDNQSRPVFLIIFKMKRGV
jgi:hypothetical protein